MIPVALMGGFLGMYAVGFTINQLSLFGMVLVIGIVVDDAIVVIENVERIMAEEGLSPKDATRKAMGQISGAVVAIAVVLMAVFIPSALQAGSVGAIYRQFCFTIALSTAFSAFLALGFTPALCASLLKPIHETKKNVVFRKFNSLFDWTQNTYTGHVRGAIRHRWLWMGIFAVVAVLCVFLFQRLPGSFLPEEDQGYALGIVLVARGREHRTHERGDGPARHDRAQESRSRWRRHRRRASVSSVRAKTSAWRSSASSRGIERKANATDLIKQLNGAIFMGIKDAQAFVVNLPTINGLGQFGGFDMYLQDRAGAGHEALLNAQNILLGKAAQQRAILTGVRPNGLQDTPQLAMKVDRVQAQSMGMSLTDVYTAIQLMLAPVYVNDFFYQGRVLRVNMQADAPFRMTPDALGHFYVPSTLTARRRAAPVRSTSRQRHDEGQADDSDFERRAAATGRWARRASCATTVIRRSRSSARRRPAGAPARRWTRCRTIIKNDLPQGFSFDWAGQSLQEIISGNQAPMLYALSILVVFLCLAALYESWSIPVAVLLVVPLGILGAVLADANCAA